MKKIYLLLSLATFSFSIQAQTITKSGNEPAVNDINTKRRFDSVGVVPKNTGANLVWNFNGFASTSNTAIAVYTTAVSFPASSSFTDATLAESGATSGDINFWKAATTPTTQFELHGINNPLGTNINYSSNPLIVIVWPVSFGSSTSDVGSGTVAVSSSTGTGASTVVTTGAGTGTLILPANVTYTNVIQVKMTQTVHIEVGTFPSSATVHVLSTEYMYYNNLQKYPLVTVSYENETTTTVSGPTTTPSAKIWINSNIVNTGINEVNFEAAFDMYPNPAKDNFSINLENTNSDKGSVEIYNELGQLSKRVDLGNEAVIKTNVSVSDLKPGVYLVKTSIGSRTSTRKLIIQ